PSLRLCRTCGQAKPPDAFAYRASRCRDCDRARLRELDRKRREQRWEERRAERLFAEPEWRDLEPEEVRAKIDGIIARLNAGADMTDVWPEWFCTNWPDPDDDD